MVSNTVRRFSINNFTSLRTSNLLFEGGSINAIARELTPVALSTLLERKWYELNEYVNANGGWTAVGWFQRGRIPSTAAADVPDIPVLAQEVTFHVCRLNPTKTATIRHIALHHVITNDELHAAVQNNMRTGSDDDDI